MQSDSLCINTLMYDANTQNMKIAEKKDIILKIFSSISFPPKKRFLLTEATAEILTICHADVLPHAGWIPTPIFFSLVEGTSFKSFQLVRCSPDHVVIKLYFTHSFLFFSDFTDAPSDPHRLDLHTRKNKQTISKEGISYWLRN